MNRSTLDVLCIGHACYDQIFSIDHHPASDEKLFADNLLECGGGPAANAAIAVARLGYQSAFAGYLGEDTYGEQHAKELLEHNVDCRYLIRGHHPTPLSAILVKPNGDRALINYKGATKSLAADAINFSGLEVKTILFDGHEPEISTSLINSAFTKNIPTVLDAGSMHKGTEHLWNKVDYLVASEKFSREFSDDVNIALTRMAEQSTTVVITLGEKGLIWKTGNESGKMCAFSIEAVDTTGAGDAFHGAFAAAISAGMGWEEVLNYSSMVGAITCTKMGARQGLPWAHELSAFSTLVNK